ncbi:hypothetical protein KSW81_008411 [Nannochloris sp. 'desiccata']|nr:hypothetical protein KSW81_008411 [Chlorella desiccata (nom. nud.)]
MHPGTWPEDGQILMIARTADDRGGEELARVHPQIRGCPQHRHDRIVAQGRVAHDSFADALPAGLELRLDQHDERHLGADSGDDGRQNERERDEAQVGDHEVDRLGGRYCSPAHLGKPFCRQRSSVLALDDDHARVGPQRRIELPVPDIERDHAPRAALEQHLREAARRSAEVECVSASDIEPGRIKCSRELEGRPADVAVISVDL